MLFQKLPEWSALVFCPAFRYCDVYQVFSETTVLQHFGKKNVLFFPGQCFKRGQEDLCRSTFSFHDCLLRLPIRELRPHLLLDCTIQQSRIYPDIAAEWRIPEKLHVPFGIQIFFDFNSRRSYTGRCPASFGIQNFLDFNKDVHTWGAAPDLGSL
jgi:hypothetical protein